MRRACSHREIVEAALTAPVVVADPKPANIALFAGVTCVAPNASEAAQITVDSLDVTRFARTRGARHRSNVSRCKYVLVTQGEHGMTLYGRDGEHLTVPAAARTVYDVSGAGDTVVAVLSLALAARAPIHSAMQLANFAAGVVVEKLGTATASPDEILALLEASEH